MSENTHSTDGPHAARPDDERAAVDEATLEAAAVETYRASQGGDGPDAGDRDGTADADTGVDTDGTDTDTDTDTQGAPATGADATPDGDVAQPLGGTLSGEEDYVAASPAGLSGEQDAALAADVHSADPEAGAHRGDIGANRGGSGGR